MTEDEELRALIARLDAELAAQAPVPQAKRKYTPMSDETRLHMLLVRELGYDPVPKRRPGRPPGAKNKPKPEGYRKPPRKPVALFNRTVACRHFTLVRGRLHRLVGHDPDAAADPTSRLPVAYIGEPAAHKHHGHSQRGLYEPLTVVYKGQRELATTVAWWLIHDTDVPDGYEVKCYDLSNNPVFSAETLFLAKFDH